MTADQQVDAGFAQPQVAQHDFIEENGQPWIAQADLRSLGIEFEPKRRFQQRERRGAGPGLRRASDRIKRRPAMALAAEAAEQFRQPPQVHIGRGVEQALEDVLDRMHQTVARQPERDQRVVVRPDRPVMIGHRIVAGLAERNGANAPTGEEMRPHQIGRDAPRAVVAYHAAEQQMAGIRGAHRAGLLLAVKRQRVGAELLAPECLLETLRQLPGLDLEPMRDLAPAEPLRATRRQPLGGEHIALHLGQRDIAFGQRAVGMEDRVEGILPALVAQPLVGRALIFDKAVAVGVAGAIDPAQRGFDRRP